MCFVYVGNITQMLEKQLKVNWNMFRGIILLYCSLVGESHVDPPSLDILKHNYLKDNQQIFHMLKKGYQKNKKRKILTHLTVSFHYFVLVGRN